MNAAKRPFVMMVLLIVLLSTNVNQSFAQSQGGDAAPKLELARGEDGKATLAFTAVPGAKLYAVRVVADDGKSEIIEGVEVVDYTVQGLGNGRNYRFAVSAILDGRKGPWSNELSASPVDQPDWNTLREAFASGNPTRNSNPFTMVHGDESEAELRGVMRAVYDAGFEGVTLHPYTYKDYLGPGHWDRWKIIFDQARRLGLVVWQQDDLDYPSGFAAGKVVAANPEFGRTTLVEAARRELKGPRSGFILDIKPLLKNRDFLVSVSAYPEDGEPLDLTDRVVDDRLVWDVPIGKWRLFVMKAVWQGPRKVAGTSGPMPFVDFMNPRATDAYISAIYQASFEQFGSDFGRTFKGFFTDEAPVDFTQFTPDFLERFEKAKGYSIRKWLPSVTQDLSTRDKKIRYDYRDFIREQMATVFFGRSRKWCREHGIQFIGHVIDDHQMDMRRLECLDIPGFDNVFDQWYAPVQDAYWRQPKMAASVAHYGGVRNDIVLVEHFAATGWQTGLSEMKCMMDWTTAMGINQVVPCGLDTRTPPAWEVAPDFWLHGRNPQWLHFPAYQSAANRMTMLMRGGRHVAPAIVLDTTESEWLNTKIVGKLDHNKDQAWRVCAAMCQAHVDFDLIPHYVFSDGRRTTFDRGRIRIGKEDYRAVILPETASIPAAAAERLREFYDAGGIVVAVNNFPITSCNGQEDERVKAAVDGIWGAVAGKRGKSAVANYDELEACLAGLNVPDVRVSPQAKALLYCHRQLHGKELYFFANTGSDCIAPTIELRGVRGTATLWNPVSGEIVEAPRYSIQDDGLKLNLEFGEYESVFVVVDPSGERRKAAAEVPARSKGIVLPGPWQVRNGSDAYHRVFSTEVQLPSDWPAESSAQLEMKGASQIICVQVNGKAGGWQFCSPYRFEVGEHLRPGVNRIEIERVGRYSAPAGHKRIEKFCLVDDSTAVVPCREATLSSLPKSNAKSPISGESEK